MAAIIYTYSRGDALAVMAILVAAIIYKRPNPLLLVVGGVLLLASLPLLPRQLSGPPDDRDPDGAGQHADDLQ